MSKKCPLCTQNGLPFSTHKSRTFYQCSNCKGLFLDSCLYLSAKEEEACYKHHNNDVDDVHYQKFVSPITSAVLRDFMPSDKGLDFGAGTGPVISKVLNDNGFSIEQYDPFFHKSSHILEQHYQYIVCCEVMEHFHNPQKEFALLKRLLLPNGKLYCMTEIFGNSENFDRWYYKNDPTHVFIYQEETMHYLAKEFKFSNVEINKRLIVFSN